MKANILAFGKARIREDKENKQKTATIRIQIIYRVIVINIVGRSINCNIRVRTSLFISRD